MGLTSVIVQPVSPVGISEMLKIYKADSFMMKKTINEIWIRILGKFPIEKKLKMGEDVILEVKVCKDARELKDNNDGSVDLIEKVRILEVKVQDEK